MLQVNPVELRPLFANATGTLQMCLTRRYYVNGFFGRFSVFGLLVNYAAWQQFNYLLLPFFFWFIFICTLLGEFLRVSLFTSVMWQSFSALIRGVWNPQAAIKTSYASPSLHRFAQVFVPQLTFTQVSATCPHPLHISASVVVPAWALARSNH